MSAGCYVGRCKCGSITSAIVIDAGRGDPKTWRREVAKFCAQVIRDGDDLERMTTEQVRGALERCKCPKPATAKQEVLALQ